MAPNDLNYGRLPRSNHSRSRDDASDATFTTQRGQHPMGKGERLFTGPGGIRDYRAHVVTDDRMVGIGTMSPEGTSSLQYIWRGATGTPPPRPRSSWAGEIGWHVPYIDWANVTSGHQLSRATFRQAQEDKFTHRWQEPWYPAPNHPDYQKSYPVTKGNPRGTVFIVDSKNPYSNQPRRPHTVAGFRFDERRNVTAHAQPLVSQRSGYSSDFSGSSQSLNRPASGSSHSQAGRNFRPNSGASISLHERHPSSNFSQRKTPVNSRPSSVNYNSRDGAISRERPPSINLSYGENPSPQSRHSSRRSSCQSRGSKISLGSGRTGSLKRGIVPAATSYTTDR